MLLAGILPGKKSDIAKILVRLDYLLEKIKVFFTVDDVSPCYEL